MIMLTQLEIEHYKGFFDKQSFDFAIPDNEKDGSGLTLIVGPNNTGKITVIESLLLNKDKKFKESERHKGDSPNITIKTNQGNYKFTNIDGGSQVRAEEDHGIKFEVVQSRRYWQHHSPETWNIETFANESSRYETRNSSGLNTAAVLMGINKNSAQKDKLNRYMKELIPHFSSWTIDSGEQGDYVKYGTAGHEHQASFLGDGIISLFRICAHLVNGSNNRVLIIDEPELSLHPTAQKTLAKLLAKAACSRQIIICTHSPYFASWEDFLNGAKFIRLNKINDVKCEASFLDNSKDYGKFIENNLLEWQKPQMLDLVAKEILFTENVLLVEGQQDVGLIRKWLKENGKNQNFDIFGYGVGSYSNMRLFLEMAHDLGLHKVAALYDSGKDADQYYADDKAKYTKYLFRKLSTSDIRDKLDDKKPKNGIFNESGLIKENYKEEFERIMSDIISHLT